MSLENNQIITSEALAFLTRYINNPSPTGYEWRGQNIWLDYTKPYFDQYELDNYGTVYGVINPDKPYKVVIEAHADEIAWIVSHITDDGLLYVYRNGGSDQLQALSKRVNVFSRTMETSVKAVFGWTAIHLRRENDTIPKVENLFLDCGCKTKQEVLDLGINIGSIAVYEDEFMTLNNRYYVGRALDNRIGGFMIAQVARLLRENNIELPYSLYVVNSVQEEVGLHGATMISRHIQPDVAIVTDVTHDTTTPGISRTKFGEMKSGDGPAVGLGPAVQNRLADLILAAASGNEIPHQVEVCGDNTGTDTEAFAYSNKGAVSALISLPLRYMHSTVEMVHQDDVMNTIKLMYYALQKIEANHNFKYF
jgi:putative aminopeptidase FrvX